MVAPTDLYVLFGSGDLHETRAEELRAHAEQSQHRVHALLADGPIAGQIAHTQSRIERAPLGFVGANEFQAQEALAAGADEAIALDEGFGDASITRFLDRLRVRASIRRRDERRIHDLAQAEKLTALGTLVAGVGHELNNPLSSLTLGLDILHELVVPDLQVVWQAHEEVQRMGHLSPQREAELLGKVQGARAGIPELLQTMLGSAEHLTQLVGDLRVFARRSGGERPSTFTVQEVIERALRLVRRELGANVLVEEDYAEELPPLHLPQNRLAQVLTNLFVNAAHALREIERPVHRLRITARVDDSFLGLSIQDSGPGIDQDSLERVFDPFFTTKREGHGTGLGLSISRSIIEEMGGELSVASILGDGATFLLLLPLAESQEDQQPRTRSTQPPPLVRPAAPSRPGILVIEDDESLQHMVARCLSPSHRLLFASSGAEAQQLLLTESSVDAVLMELGLPEMDGPNFWNWLSKNHPGLAERTIVTTAMPDRPQHAHFLRESGLPVVDKPLRKKALVTTLAHVLGAETI